MERSSVDNIRKLDFKWKTKRWFLMVFLFNILTPFLIILDRLFALKENFHRNSIIPQIVIFPLLLTVVFLSYIYLSRKFFKDYGEVIKPERFKHLYRALGLSITIFCLYIVFLASSWFSLDGNYDWPSPVIYIILVLTFLLGTISTAFISIYEFSISFDIFYNQNKNEIVEEYLRRSGNTLKIEQREETIDED